MSVADSPEPIKVKSGKNKTSIKKIILIIIGVSLLVGFIGAALEDTDSADSSQKNTPKIEEKESIKSENIEADKKERVVKGEQITLAAGQFESPRDIKPGLYDVTPGGGQGNFHISGSNTYNEILGGDYGVNRVRVDLADNSSIEVSGLSNVIFTPVSSPFVTEYKETELYAGTFTVGEDIAAGRYIVKPGAGQEGNFHVSGSSFVNEILGGEYGVPEYSVTLESGDNIELSSFNSVLFSPKR